MEQNNILMKRNLLFSALLLVASCKEKADLVIIGARIYTCDSSFATSEAVAIKDGIIVETGSKASITAKYAAGQTIDEPYKYIYPGFIDAHCHFSAYALSSDKIDLVGTASWQEVLERVVEYSQKPENRNKQICYGRGWDQNDWTVKTFPDKKQLDSLFPNTAIILKRVDGHALLCNQKALDMAGINPETTIEGGIIQKKNGLLTGILIDNATDPVDALLEKAEKTNAIPRLQEAEKEMFSYGLTGVVDCGVKTDVIRLLMKQYEEGNLSIANSVLLSQDDETIKTFTDMGFYKNGQFQINGIKVYADGALGSRGACLLQEYSDMPGHFGLILTDITKITRLAEIAKAHKLQLCTHAIGDSANRTILGLYSRFLPENNDLRWRIEHAQVVDYQDYEWFSTYNIIPSVQPTHAISDMPWAGSRLGEQRLPTAYAYKNLLAQNGWIALGTDFPVESIDPLGTFYTAVARKDKKGQPGNGFMKENALTRKEALMGMTYWAAKSVFWEKERGSIEKGKKAELVILDKDIMTINEKELKDVHVIYTIINGKLVYKKGDE